MSRARLVAALVAVNATLVGLGHLVAPAYVSRRPDVGLVFDIGGKDDKSFNDAAWRGLRRARDELGIAVATLEPSDGADREAALRQLAAKRRARLVIGVGFMFSSDLDRMAARFPAVDFAGVDYAPTAGHVMPPNLVGLSFREHEGSFVVGAIAGMTTRTHVVGFVGGMRNPLIRKFEVGYIAGVKHVCPSCTVLSAYAGNDPKAFADPTQGQELASAQYDQGADIIFHASGKTGAGVIAAARARGKLVIGVDIDQFAEAPCCVLTSMIKKVDVAVDDIVHDAMAGRFHGGGIRELGLKENGLGFVADEHNRKLLPPAVVARARAITRQIIDGEIVVPSQ